jgi:hypothetical protein
VIIADAWLLDLAMEGVNQQTVAHVCLVCQVRVFFRTGHILALNDERARTDIRRAARSAHIPHTIVRCLRCGERAWFLDWWASVCLMTPAKAHLLDAYREHVETLGYGFMKPCTGDEHAIGMSYLV